MLGKRFACGGPLSFIFVLVLASCHGFTHFNMVLSVRWLPASVLLISSYKSVVQRCLLSAVK